jgi:hypothetical protein
LTKYVIYGQKSDNVSLVYKGQREPATSKGANLMLRKVTIITDSALLRKMNFSDGMGKILRNSKGYWECRRLVTDILEIGLAEERDGESYKGPHDLKFIASPISRGFTDYCEMVEKCNRVEAVIKWILESHFEMEIYFFTPEKTKYIGHLTFKMSLEGQGGLAWHVF